MKNIKDTILEKLKINKSEIKISELDNPDKISQQLYNKGDDREKAINNIVAELESDSDYKVIPIKKINEYPNYFIEVSELHNGDLLLGFFEKITFTDYKIIFFSNNKYHSVPNLEFYSWKELRRNLSSLGKQYLIPEDSILNDICDSIFKEFKR